MTDNDKHVMRNTLKDWEDRMNMDAPVDDPFSPYVFDIADASVVVRDPSTGSLESRNVVLIHFHPTNTLVPAETEDSADLDVDVAPELVIPENDLDDIAVTVIRPLCDEAGLTEWAQDLFMIKDKKEREKALKKIVRGGEGNPQTLRSEPLQTVR